MKIDPRWRYDPFGTFETCASCLGSLQAAIIEDRVNLVCMSCGCCWHVFLGYLNLVDSRTCPGCALRHLCSVNADLACLVGEQPTHDYSEPDPDPAGRGR